MDEQYYINCIVKGIERYFRIFAQSDIIHNHMGSIEWINTNSFIEVERVKNFSDFQQWIDTVNSALHGWKMIDAEHYFSWVSQNNLAFYIGFLNSVPVFTNFQGGIGIIVGPTGGYLIGYIAASFIISTKTKIFDTLTMCVIPFFIGDIVKILLATIMSKRLYKNFST